MLEWKGSSFLTCSVLYDAHVVCVEAFDVAEQLGVARLLNADDMLLLVVPDKLNVMTFVYELRAQLTGCSLPSPPASSPPQHAHTPRSVPTSGDWLSNLCPLTATEREAVDARYTAASQRTSTEATSLVQTGKHLLACVAQSSEAATSPADHRLSPPALTDSSSVLMTRQQLLNPFDSDSDSEAKSAATSPNDDAARQKLSPSAQTAETASPSNILQPQSHSAAASDQSTSSSWQQLSADGSACDDGSTASTGATARRQCSRREQLRERARMLLQQARHDALTSPTSPVVDSQDERQRQLHERARRLIAESRAGAAAGSSVTRVITIHNQKSIGEPVGTPSGEMYGSEHVLQRHDVSRLPDQHSSSPSSLSPKASYAEVEIEFLERSLARLDERAAGVEWSLRRIMDSQRHGDEDAQQQQLMYEWFALVDERGELVRRIEQLNAVAQEHDLERRFELLSVELRRLMAECETSEKDDESADRERLLLAELMSIVNQRDALVQQLDRQEQDLSENSTPVVKARQSSSQDSGCLVQ